MNEASNDTLPPKPEKTPRYWLLVGAAWTAASLGSVIGGQWLTAWKQRQLEARGLWPKQYGEAVTLSLYGDVLALVCLAGMMVCLLNWFSAAKARRAAKSS